MYPRVREELLKQNSKIIINSFNHIKLRISVNQANIKAVAERWFWPCLKPQGNYYLEYTRNSCKWKKRKNLKFQKWVKDIWVNSESKKPKYIISDENH